MPNELELIALQTEFDLYLTFVKRLVLDLPNCDDRTRAALWLQKLRSIKKDDQMKLRNEHLKLFLFALHRRSLLGVFETKPPKDELETFHDGLTLLEMTRELIEITEKKKTATKKEGEEGFGVCPLPPVRTNLSYDLKEYAACQEIPKFGSHVYYAVSNEPIQMWTKSDGQNYPDRLAVPNQFEWELSMSKLCDHVLEREAELDAKLEAEKEAESGLVFEEKEEVEEKEPEMDIKPCGSPKGSGGDPSDFKWKVDSKLLIYQSYDFSDVGIAEDLVGQGKHQLEMDEHAMNILDESLPGRKRVHIRVPYYQGLPPDFLERRHHGVYEEIPEEDICEGPPCGEEEEEEEEEAEEETTGDGGNQSFLEMSSRDDTTTDEQTCPCSCSEFNNQNTMSRTQPSPCSSQMQRPPQSQSQQQRPPQSQSQQQRPPQSQSQIQRQMQQQRQSQQPIGGGSCMSNSQPQYNGPQVSPQMSYNNNMQQQVNSCCMGGNSMVQPSYGETQYQQNYDGWGNDQGQCFQDDVGDQYNQMSQMQYQQQMPPMQYQQQMPPTQMMQYSQSYSPQMQPECSCGQGSQNRSRSYCNNI